MNNKSYSDKLRTAAWQRRRLEVMQRDDFTCQRCGDNEGFLNVHHRKYKGGHPADSPMEDLETLCETCHGLEHLKGEIKEVKEKGLLTLEEVFKMHPEWKEKYELLESIQRKQDVFRIKAQIEVIERAKAIECELQENIKLINENSTDKEIETAMFRHQELLEERVKVSYKIQQGTYKLN